MVGALHKCRSARISWFSLTFSIRILSCLSAPKPNAQSMQTRHWLSIPPLDLDTPYNFIFFSRFHSYGLCLDIVRFLNQAVQWQVWGEGGLKFSDPRTPIKHRSLLKWNFSSNFEWTTHPVSWTNPSTSYNLRFRTIDGLILILSFSFFIENMRVILNIYTILSLFALVVHASVINYNNVEVARGTEGNSPDT